MQNAEKKETGSQDSDFITTFGTGPSRPDVPTGLDDQWGAVIPR